MAGLGVEGCVAGTIPRLPPQIAVIPGAVRGVIVVLLAIVGALLRVQSPMRPSLRIRIEFEPSRLSMGYLRSAYELTDPVVRRVVREQSVARVGESNRTTPVRASTRARSSK
jgi:hypothetical protein